MCGWWYEKMMLMVDVVVKGVAGKVVEVAVVVEMVVQTMILVL